MPFLIQIGKRGNFVGKPRYKSNGFPAEKNYLSEVTMKKQYEQAEVEVIRFADDVITTSGADNFAGWKWDNLFEGIFEEENQ